MYQQRLAQASQNHDKQLLALNPGANRTCIFPQMKDVNSQYPHHSVTETGRKREVAQIMLQSIHSGSEALPTGAFLVPEHRSGSPAIATCNDSQNMHRRGLLI